MILPDKPEIIEQVLTDDCSVKELQTQEECSPYLNHARIPWIKPYTDEILSELYTKGIRKLAVACPAFTADCLEALEEIGMRAKEQWLTLGGESLTLIPCLNSDDQWPHGVATMIKGITLF